MANRGLKANTLFNSLNPLTDKAGSKCHISRMPNLMFIRSGSFALDSPHGKCDVRAGPHSYIFSIFKVNTVYPFKPFKRVPTTQLNTNHTRNPP